MINEEAYQEAKRRVQLKAGFKKHVAVYVGVNLMLLIINLSTASDQLWFLWPLLGWSIGLLMHGLKAYVLPGSTTITDEMIRAEMEESDFV